jgi:glycosyltransferase involved in cell wall biosynthesis
LSTARSEQFVADRNDDHRGTPAGILIVGAPEAGDVLERFLTKNHLARPMGSWATDELGAATERLVREAGGTPATPALLPQSELKSRLEPLRNEALETLRRSVAARKSGMQPWVWWHPLTAFVADFWADVSDGEVVLLHAVGPAGPSIVTLATALQISIVQAEHLWADLQRAALSACDRHRSMITSTSALDEPKALALELGRFLDLPPPAPDTLHSVRHLEDTGTADIELAPSTRVLSAYLEQLSRVDDGSDPSSGDHLISVLGRFYDEDYYDNHCGDLAYRRGVEEWEHFFGAVSENIATTIKPRTVLDAGCAIGLLVEALRDRGVDATGFDISPFAISQAPPELSPYVSVKSITDEIDGQYDLITCLEVVEHLPSTLADAAIANLCRHADAVLFSSSPEDFEELSHINVHPIEVWVRKFRDQGFHRDLSYDASDIAPHAVLFRRGSLDVEAMIDGYEQRLWNEGSSYRRQLSSAREDVRAAQARVADILKAEADARQALHHLEARRAAEAAAAVDLIDEQSRAQTLLSTLADARATELEHWKQEVERIHQTKLFRHSRGLRQIYGRFRKERRLSELEITPPSSMVDVDRATGGSYSLWAATYDTLNEEDRTRLRQRTGELSDPPTFSILLPVYNTPEPYLRAAIDSVCNQIYPHWQLCIADDASTDEQVQTVLAEYADADERITVVRRQVNGHIAAASNSALEVATGSWIALLDHDDELAEHALAVIAFAITESPDVQYLYSDEDKLDANGRRSSPFFKPDFDPAMLLGENYPCHLFVARRELVEQVGGFRPGFEGSQDWDLVLRITERLAPAAISHVPHVLYHWRVHPESTASSGSAKPYAATSGVRAVEEHLARTGRYGQVIWNPATGRNRVRWDIGDPHPLVSIIIPTRDGKGLLRCLDSVRRQTAYEPYEILVVDNGSRGASTLNYLRAHEGAIKVIRDERPFNYSALNNAAVAQAEGDLLLLLNDDIEVMGGDWLDEMVGQIQRPNVGIVGAKLDYPDGTIQHAGVTLGIYGVAGHLHKGVDRFDLGYFGDLALTRQVSAVTGACMLVRRNLWNELGGLDAENLAIAFNDIDFCLRAREAGWAVIWTPFAELIHHESISRGPDDLGPRADEFRREVRFMKDRWGHLLRNDPAYNPNLTLLGEHAELSWPPRSSYARGAL